MKPLYTLLQKNDAVQNYKKRKKCKTSEILGKNYNKNECIIWNACLQNIMNSVTDYLKSPEIIAHPDFEKPFFVNCDASGDGLGTVLYQKQNDVNQVISYASRTLTGAEKNYHLHSSKLEFLALKWALTEKFGDCEIWSPLCSI